MVFVWIGDSTFALGRETVYISASTSCSSSKSSTHLTSSLSRSSSTTHVFCGKSFDFQEENIRGVCRSVHVRVNDMRDIHDGLHSSLTAIVDALTSIFESQSSSFRGVCVVCGFDQGYACHLATTLVEHLKWNVPEISVTALALTPFGGLEGLGYYNAAVACNTFVRTADRFIVRGLDDGLLMTRSDDTSSSGLASSQSSLSSSLGQGQSDQRDITSLTKFWTHTAGDLLVAARHGMCSFSRHSQDWMDAAISHDSNVMDIRSSWWRQCVNASATKTKTKVQKFKPVRDMAMNLRSLHNSQQFSSMPRSLSASPSKVKSTIQSKLLSKLDLHVTRAALLDESPEDNAQITTSEISTALTYAAPSMTWSELTLLKSPLPTSASVRSVVAIAFDSPYAVQSIHNIQSRARSLASRGAYLHSFKDSSGIDVEDLMTAIRL
jgi:hypothetical protein